MKLKYNLSFYYISILTFVFPLIPKEYGTLFNIIPTRLSLISILFIIIFHEILTKKIKLRKAKIGVFMLTYVIFIFTMLLSYNYAIDKLLFFYGISKYICFGMLLYILIKYPFNKKQINYLINLLLFSTLITIMYSFVQYSFDLNMTKNGIYKYPGALGRVDANFYNANYYAIFLLGMTLLSFYKLSITTSNKAKTFCISIIFLNTVAILLTFTRSVYLLLVIVFLSVFLLSIFKRNKKHVFLCFLPILFLGLLLYIIPGTKYVYSSSLVQMLPNKYSIDFLNFTNKRLFTNIDLSIYLKNPVNSGQNNNVGGDNNNVGGDNNNFFDDYDIIDDASLESRSEFKEIVKRVIQDYPYTGVGIGNYEKFVLSNQDKYLSNNKKFGYPHDSLLHLEVESGKFNVIMLYIIIIGSIFIFLILGFSTKKSAYIYLSILWCSILILAKYESLFYDTQLFPLLLIITTFIINSIRLNNEENKIMFISSVGGHLTQMLELKFIFKKYSYVLVTEKTEVTKDMNLKYNMEFLLYGSRQYIISYLFKFVLNILKSLYLFIKYNPDVIITTGTHTAVPMCYIGFVFRKKIIFIESFAKRTSPTLSGRLVYPIASTFVVQWEEMLRFYPKAVYWGWLY